MGHKETLNIKINIMRVGKIFVDIAVLLKGGIFEVSLKEKETYSKRRVSQVSLAKRCSSLSSLQKKTFIFSANGSVARRCVLKPQNCIIQNIIFISTNLIFYTYFSYYLARYTA